MFARILAPMWVGEVELFREEEIDVSVSVDVDVTVCVTVRTAPSEGASSRPEAMRPAATVPATTIHVRFDSEWFRCPDKNSNPR